MLRTMALVCAVAVSLAQLTGCATSAPSASVGSPAAVEPVPANVADQQVALDFVNAIVQLVGTDAAPLHFRPDAGEEAVLGTIRTMLGQAGYRIEPAAEGQGDQLVRHQAAVIESGGERLRRHDVAVGDIALRRSYRSTGTGTLLPASALYVRGANAASIRMMDDALFGIDGAGDDGPPPALPDELLVSYHYLLTDAR